ncbi:AMP-binding protein [Actinocorallia lasiicapitis]
MGSGVLRMLRPFRTLRALSALHAWGTTLGGLAKAAAIAQPGKAAVIDDDGSVTYGELDARSDEQAGALPLAGSPRPRVGIMCRNHQAFIETLVACSKRGAETVLINTGFGPGQLRAVLSELRMDLIVADLESAAVLGSCPAHLRKTVVWSDAGAAPDDLLLEQLIAEAGDEPAEPPHTQGRTIMLSSGTSGRPKGARRRPKPGIRPLASMLSRIPLRNRHTFVVDAPVFHTWGFAALQIGFALRSTIVLRRRFDPEQTLAMVQEQRRSALFAVPVMVQRIMELPEEVRERYDTRGLRVTALSGSALPGDLAHRFMDWYGERLYNVYGSTEASWVSIAGPKELRKHPSTAGRPPRGTSVAIINDQDKKVPRATIGRIFAANENVFEGYTSGEPTDTLNGLLFTGDLGHLDAHGMLYVDGRHDGMVVSGGENVVPHDVEDALSRLPEVREVAVAGVPDEEYGQRLAAYIVLRPGAGLTEQAVRDYVREQVARYAVPRDVHFIGELPRNATGKIVYRWLAGMQSGRMRTPEGRVTFWPDPQAHPRTPAAPAPREPSQEKPSQEEEPSHELAAAPTAWDT